ncbi:MAG: helix-turn-helix transcriptional regulator [Actinomycetota bacterium]
MVNLGHQGDQHIVDVHFDGPHAALPVEVLQRRDVIARFDRAHFARPQRHTFRQLMLVHGSGGYHSIDFERVALLPRRLIALRPGQVHRWDASTPTEATIVLGQAWVGGDERWFPGQPSYTDLDGARYAAASGLIDAMANAQSEFEPRGAAERILIATFAALEALFALSATPERDRVANNDPYTAYRQSIESAMAVGEPPHNVADYAATLPFSARTVARACARATGQTPKQLLDQRIVLEAQRLLANTDMSAASIGARLGFSEPTNFAKFYARGTGQTPAAFRRTASAS